MVCWLSKNILAKVMVLWLSQKPQRRNISQTYGIVAFPEAAKNTISQGYSAVAFLVVVAEKC